MGTIGKGAGKLSYVFFPHILFVLHDEPVITNRIWKDVNDTTGSSPPIGDNLASSLLSVRVIVILVPLIGSHGYE